MGRKKSITDEQLLDVARDAFVEKGIAASTREIAKRANISEAVIYQRYDTKVDLFFAAMAPPAVDLEEMLKPDTGNEDVQERLEKIAFHMLAYFREIMPTLLLLITHPSFDYEEFVERNPESPLTLIREGLMRYLSHQADAGNVREDNYAATGLVFVGTIHSIAMFEKMGAHGGHFDEKMIKNVVKSIWEGLKP